MWLMVNTWYVPAQESGTQVTTTVKATNVYYHHMITKHKL